MSSNLSSPPPRRDEDLQEPPLQLCERIAERMDGFLYRCQADQGLTMRVLLGAVAATTGFSRNALLDSRQVAYAQLIHPDDRPRVRGARVRAVTAEEEWSIDYRLCHPDGSIHWVNDRGAAILNPQGAPLYFEGAVVDISARKRAEHALERTSLALRERFKEVACLGEVAALTNRDVSVDETLTAAAGFLPSGWQYPTRCEAAIFYRGKRYATSRREPGRWRLEAPIRVAGAVSGKVVVWFVRTPPQPNAPFLNEERHLIERIALILGQYLYRKQAEQEREQLLQLIEASPDYIATLNPQGRPLYQNPALRGLIGDHQHQPPPGHPPTARRGPADRCGRGRLARRDGTL
ncbi:hypothetical protein CKO15_11600 [Halorhodospira abdelmalekii]|uniref:PAS domain-containing protein n=1 Tax=Halorhodospira abdelmalekii TaxID=421629 RepID=UPI001902DFE1|nr:PAS domain-containing protein [Halorhodospira abdelmalekii]MBK1735910.1 hypothetical protein [Halorhodospira abdelmalekii]